MKIGVFAGRRGMYQGKPIPLGGSGRYRQYLPHELMAQWGHEVIFTDLVDFNILKDYDIVQFSKSNFVQALPLIEDLKKAGVKTVIDYDDFWSLPSSHYLELAYKSQGTTKLLIDTLRLFDYITVTTPLLRDEVAKINPNVAVFENAVDPLNPQFAIRDSPSENVRFGWVGGHCHYGDILMLDGSPQRLNGKFEISLFGHDRKEGSVYDLFGFILSGRLKLVNENRFNIYEGTTAIKYTQFYNKIDVALAPLVDDKFNSLKSELKMIEAGFMKKAMIVSDVWPYKYVINDSNCLTVKHKHHWSKQMQKLINDPNRIEDLGEALYESVKDKYDLEKVTRRREEWYQSII